jgi:hypothetical protein
MFGKMVEMIGGVSARPNRHAKMMLGVAAGLAFLGGSKAMSQTTPLFTTVQDFTGWSNGGGSPVASFGPSTAYDADGSSVNGLGNTTTPGGAGTPGSMQINTGGNAIGYIYTVFSTNLFGTPAISALDPGASGAGTVAYSGTLYMTYTAPSFVGPDAYYNVGVDFAYAGDGFYGPQFNTSNINDGVIDGLQTYTAVIPYTLVASTGTAMTLSPFLNAGTYGSGVSGVSNVMNTPWYVDEFAVPTSQVPEPATISVLGAGLTMLTLRRRRQA